MDFSWDEVHEVAEELEHINSKKLIRQLEKFLDFPEFDPHGDPIPNEKGIFKKQSNKTLSEAAIGKQYKIVSVKDNSRSFLKYVVSLGLGINKRIKVISKEEFDGQVLVEIDGEVRSVSQKLADNVFLI